uniref:Uncharacterized protein n=1 Tax=Anopheles coluzzii TaxID=1518534 RepID=A0A8W7PDE8_ANOCL
MKAIGTPTNIPLIGWVLVAVAIMHWYQPLVATYNVAEHRLDYIKLGEGREYNYHYNDGVSSGYDKRKFYKRPQALKQPYTLKSFASPVEQIATNEFQTQPQQTYMTQESLLPVYESHEKTNFHYYYNDDDNDNASSTEQTASLKYSSSSRPTTANRPAATASNGSGNPTLQPYEPEFDIDIRIDLRDDSA